MAAPPTVTLRVEAALDAARRAHPDLVARVEAILHPYLARRKRHGRSSYQPTPLPLPWVSWPAGIDPPVASQSAQPVPQISALSPDPAMLSALAELRDEYQQHIAALETRAAALWVCRRVEHQQVYSGYDEPVSRYEPQLDRLVPVYEWVAGPPASRAATREAMVERLTTMPPYHALVRVRVGERDSWQGELRPAPFAPPQLDSSKLARVREHSRRQFYQRREDVEQAIRCRQETRTGSSDTPNGPGRSATVVRRGPVRRREVVE